MTSSPRLHFLILLGLVVSLTLQASDAVVPTLVPAPGSPFVVGAAPFGVAVADFNRDGLQDIVVANTQSDNVTLLLGMQSGGFRQAAGSPFPTVAKPHYVVPGDINQDGKQDLIVAPHDGSYELTVLMGDGRGGFQPIRHDLRLWESKTPHCHGLASVDMNKDRRPDLVALLAGDLRVNVLLGDGRGRFSPASGSPTRVEEIPSSFAVLDVNQDGALDLVHLNEASRNLSILFGDGQGGLAASPSSPLLLAADAHSLVAADFTSDGIADLVITSGESRSFSLLIGDGRGGFRPAGAPVPTEANAYSIAAGDFNGDGHRDVAIASDDSLLLRLGDGRGDFRRAAGAPYRHADDPTMLAVADLNRDGKSDVVVSNRASNTIAVFMGR